MQRADHRKVSGNSVCHCAGKKVADYWETAKKVLNDPSKFLDTLTTFDKDNISDAIIKKVGREGRDFLVASLWLRVLYRKQL